MHTNFIFLQNTSWSILFRGSSTKISLKKHLKKQNFINPMRYAGIYAKLRSTSSLKSTSNPQIHVRFLRHRHLYFKIGVKFSDLWPFLTLSNRCPMTSLTYSLTEKYDIDRRIWKECRF